MLLRFALMLKASLFSCFQNAIFFRHQFHSFEPSNIFALDDGLDFYTAMPAARQPAFRLRLLPSAGLHIFAASRPARRAWAARLRPPTAYARRAFSFRLIPPRRL